jgi:hypothetical protein
MILPVRRGGLDRQALPLCTKKKNVSQRRGAAKEERNSFAPFLLCVFA